MATNGPFFWGANGEQLTPEQARMQHEMAAELAGAPPDFSPVGSPLQGLARVANAMAGAYQRQGQAFPDAPGGATPSFGTQLANFWTMRNNGGLY